MSITLPTLLMLALPGALLPMCSETAWSQSPTSDASKSDRDALLEFERIQSEFARGLSVYRAAWRKLDKTPEFRAAAEAGDDATIQRLRARLVPPDKEAYCARFLHLAGEQAGRTAATRSLTWIVFEMGRRPDLVKSSLDELRASHLQNAELSHLLENEKLLRVLPGEEILPFLHAVVEETSHTELEAAALCARSRFYLRTWSGRSPSDADKAAAKADFRRAAKLAKCSTVGLWAEGERFEEEHLQVGMPAPDIRGRDLNGEPMSLLDFRGKVVLLDFWGDW